MTTWVFCGKRFTEGDVVEWTENILEERWVGRGKNRRKELPSVGEVRIAAQLLREEGDWIFLEVREIEVLEDRSEGKRALPLPAVGKEIRRKRNTVERGKPKRLQWKDGSAPAECVRTRVVVERRKKVKIRKEKNISGAFSRAGSRKPAPEK